MRGPFSAEPPYRPTRGVNIAANLGQITSTLASRSIARDVAAVAARIHPDVVLVDTMLLSAVRASVGTGLPTVALVHTLPSFFARSYARGPVGAVAALRGFPMGRVWGTATATLATVLPGLDTTSEQDPRPWPCLRFIGPVTPHPPPVPAIPVSLTHTKSVTRPRILVSLSTNWFPGQEPTVRKLLEAVGQLDLDAMVTVGRSMDPAMLPAPPNAEVVRLADHDALLPTVDLLVGHGGHGTTMRALSHGVPVLVIPSFDFTDQPAIGALVSDAGAGRILARKASIEALGSASKNWRAPVLTGTPQPPSNSGCKHWTRQAPPPLRYERSPARPARHPARRHPNLKDDTRRNSTPKPCERPRQFRVAAAQAICGM